jgi:hypothetical protein
MRWWWLGLAVAGCAKAPLQMHLDGLPAPWLTLDRDGRIFAYNGELTGIYDAASQTVFIEDLDWPRSVGAGPDGREWCSVHDDGTFRCEQQVGHVEPWRGRWGTDHDALFAVVRTWRGPQALMMRLILKLDGVTLHEGTAVVAPDGTIHDRYCPAPAWRGCDAIPTPIGRWTEDEVIFDDGTRVQVTDHVCHGVWCARLPTVANGTFDAGPLLPPPFDPVVIETPGSVTAAQRRVAFALAASQLLSQLGSIEDVFGKLLHRGAAPP